jgi:uncharacterized protein YndB with AHSA1/START domain
MSEIGATSSVTINASAKDVWEALTTPELIKQWFFGVDTETDWKVGSPLVHKGVWQGKPYEDKGEILRFEPLIVLAHTHWSPLSVLPDSPENYEQVTWELTEREGATELTITEANIPSEEAKAVSEEGWKTALNSVPAARHACRSQGKAQPGRGAGDSGSSRLRPRAPRAVSPAKPGRRHAQRPQEAIARLAHATAVSPDAPTRREARAVMSSPAVIRGMSDHFRLTGGMPAGLVPRQLAASR